MGKKLEKELKNFFYILKNKKEYFFLFFLFLVSSALFFFSYFWIDEGVILMISEGHPIIKNILSIATFRKTNREVLAFCYLGLLFLFFLFHLFFLFSSFLEKINFKKLFLIFGIFTLIFSFSYPFLSYDFFTYLFSAKMVLFYHVNPYRVPPEDFLKTDFMVGILRNIQFTYSYGPLFLLYSLLPALIFSPQRFILNFFSLKLMNAFLFWFTGWIIFEMRNKDTKSFSWWFLNPFLIIELLVNAHSDLLMIALFITGTFLLTKNIFIGILFNIGSVLTKYISVIGIPGLFLTAKWREYFFKFMILTLFVFLFFQKIRITQPWYYSWIYMFLPFVNFKKETIALINLMLVFILAFNYYPFLKTGGWMGKFFFPDLKIFGFLFLVIIIVLEKNFFKKLNENKVLFQRKK